MNIIESLCILFFSAYFLLTGIEFAINRDRKTAIVFILFSMVEFTIFLLDVYGIFYNIGIIK